MGLAKSGTTATKTDNPNGTSASAVASQEGGASAALDRLSKGTTAAKAAVKTSYKERDFDAEARGKTRCALFAAALQSPAIAGLKFKDLNGLLAMAEEAAEYGVAYSFGDKK